MYKRKIDNSRSRQLVVPILLELEPHISDHLPRQGRCTILCEPCCDQLPSRMPMLAAAIEDTGLHMALWISHPAADCGVGRSKNNADTDASPRRRHFVCGASNKIWILSISGASSSDHRVFCVKLRNQKGGSSVDVHKYSSI
ncbi:hypothetical protein M404DRAFT_921170 [Pisolithus tinctorius Marx 270]|uniref:Uncharacterized protein n=1 Tax=Pisolithus tinctorius Marx 270 TaxID=870435 RepID=A0A0C3NN73_PISTI|nr:hypothetical protein M404DRAFT_921170 [Pisolithus tinctorius Marx 270]